MSRRLVNLTLDTLEDLPSRCRQCVFWELDPVSAERACATGDPGLEKEAWVSQALLEWGSCGKLIYVDGMAAGFALYSPPAYVPRSMAIRCAIETMRPDRGTEEFSEYDAKQWNGP